VRVSLILDGLLSQVSRTHIVHSGRYALVPAELLLRTSSSVQEQRRQAHSTLERFEHTALLHLDAAYNLARWLTRNDHDAEDVVQEAYLRAWKFFSSFHGGDSRPWLLTIVRRTCYTWLQHNRAHELVTEFDEEHHSLESADSNPETLLLQRINAEVLRQALDALPVEFREVVVLREMEGLSYKDIAAITDVPQGTVMSRLARARKRLQQWLTTHAQGGLH
jgi:RNA polymerase sigma factor (sigma-70 family)